MSDNRAYRELAEQLVELQRRLDGLSVNQLAHSSLEDTGLPVYSETGQLSGMMGRLPDGSYGTATLSGPVPPIPSAPKVQAVRGVGLEIEWDGLFEDPQAVVPLEGGRLEVYVSEDPNITPVMVPAYSMGSPRGEKFLISVGYDKIHFIAFAFRAASGKVSPCSAVVGPATVGRATKEDLEVNFEDLRGTRIFYGPDEPETETADLWIRDNDDGTQTALRFDPGQVGDVGEWIELQDQGVVQALAEAVAANQKADQAGLDALAAVGKAQEAIDDSTAAGQAASTAAQAAADAAAAALAARGVADAAAGAAATAQGAASAANTKALEAAGIAASKGTVYYQTSAPAVGDLNGLWIDIDDGNKPYRYVAGAWSAVENASVKAAADAAAAADTKAVNAATAASNAAAAALAADGKAVQAAADALAASNLAKTKNKSYFQPSAPTTGMLLNDEWTDTDDGNKRYVYTGSPLAWTPALVGAAGLSATARQLGGIQILRQSTAPSAGMLLNDLWIDSDDNVLYRWEGSTPSWVKVQDVNIQAAITNAATAKAIADGKMRIFTQPSAPTGLTLDDVGDLWIDTDDSNTSYTWALITGTTYGWVARRIGNGAIEPKSLVASNVVATGTITAALFEALLVLATELIAGNPLASHARMTPQGFRVYRANDVTGIPEEVVRMGTETNDYFGIVDSAGNLVAAIDDTGRASFRAVNTASLVVAGRDVATALSAGPRGEVATFLGSPGFDLAPIFNPVGVAEVGMQVEKGRSYHFRWRCSVFVNAGVQMQFNGRWTQGADGDTITQAPAPTTTSTSFAEWRYFPAGDNKIQTVEGEAMFLATRTTRIRFGLTAQVGPDGNIGFVGVKNMPVELNVVDAGKGVGNTGGFSNMGGSLNGQTSPPPPTSVTQQYFVDLAPSGRASWTGGGGLMNWVGGDVYQGYEASNGNTRGQFWFDLPNITGTVDRVDLWVYFRHWYFNSGGTMRLGITDQRGVFTDHSFRGLWETGGWPKPGGREVNLPGDWYPLFRGTNNNSFNGRGTCLTLGPGVGTNQLYYGVATDARLRIYYTQ